MIPTDYVQNIMINLLSDIIKYTKDDGKAHEIKPLTVK